MKWMGWSVDILRGLHVPNELLLKWWQVFMKPVIKAAEQYQLIVAHNVNYLPERVNKYQKSFAIVSNVVAGNCCHELGQKRRRIILSQWHLYESFSRDLLKFWSSLMMLLMSPLSWIIIIFGNNLVFIISTFQNQYQSFWPAKMKSVL